MTVRFDGVTVRYPSADEAASPAVEDVRLEVAAGELVVLLGPSGCGKTTLLKTVNRLVEPTDGRVFVDGRDVSTVPAAELRRGVGYVIQATGLFPHMTTAENIAVVPELLGWERSRIEARIDELLGLVNLPRDYRSRYPAQLSGGEQQRVGIARALAADPGHLLMDEPFGAVDAINRERLQDELLRIQARVQKTVLFVTHDVDEALRLADRVAVLRGGRLVQYDVPLALLTAPANAFVAELLDADDVFRRLRLMTVRAVMRPDEAEEVDAAEGADGDAVAVVGDGEAVGEPSERDAVAMTDDRQRFVRPDTDLRVALSRLLRAEAGELPVVDDDGRAVGRLALADVRRQIGRVAAG